MSQTTISKAWQLAGEQDFLNAVGSDLTNPNPRLVYADWLEEQGDSQRTEFLRAFVSAMETMKANDFPDPGDLSPEWCRMIGASLLHAIAQEETLVPHKNELLALAKPALNYEMTDIPDPLEKDDFPIGATKLFGLPDLPANMSWPKQSDCKAFYDPGSGIDPETHCSFVGQINCKDLRDTQLSRYFPASGLISIFSCSEIESIGMTDGYVSYFADAESLVRTEAPSELLSPDEEANALLNPTALKLSETLQLPYPGDASPFESIRWDYSDDRSDALSRVMENSGADEQLASIGGFTQATSGDDPLPNAESMKLICVANSIEIVLHFCIPCEDLAAGKLDSVELSWVDFD